MASSRLQAIVPRELKASRLALFVPFLLAAPAAPAPEFYRADMHDLAAQKQYQAAW